MNDNTTESRFFTAAEVARCLSVSKATVLRHMNELPPEERAQGSYRGKPTYLVSEAGLVHLSILITEAQLNQATLDEVKQGTSSAATSETSAAKRNEVNQGDIVAELRARIAAQDDEIQFLREELKARRRELEALTTTNYLLLTAAQSAQDEGEPGEGVDTTPAADEAQEAASAPTEAPAPEITRATTQEAPPERATLAKRLRFLFTGRYSP